MKKTIIEGTALLLNSSDKLGRHLDSVKTGCGAHKSIKDYSRNQKHKKRLEEN